MGIFGIVKGFFSGKPLAEITGIRTEELKDKHAERTYAKAKLVSAVGRSLFLLGLVVVLGLTCSCSPTMPFKDRPFHISMGASYVHGTPSFSPGIVAGKYAGGPLIVFPSWGTPIVGAWGSVLIW